MPKHYYMNDALRVYYSNTDEVAFNVLFDVCIHYKLKHRQVSTIYLQLPQQRWLQTWWL